MTDHTNRTNSASSLVPATTAEGLANATEMLFRDDWDDQGVTAVHLPRSIARQLLEDRGWRCAAPGHLWHGPTGETIWHTDEALRTALVAEVFDPARTARSEAIDDELRRDLINTILAHDVLLDETDTLLFEHVVEGRHERHEIAATLRRLAIAAVTGAAPAYWDHIADGLIADVCDLEPEARHNPETNPPRSPER